MRRGARIAAAVVILPLLVTLVDRVTAPLRRLRVVELSTTNATMNSEWRVLAYNIAHGRGPTDDNFDGGTHAQRERRLADIAALLRTQDAEIVVLNEVDFDSVWSHGVNQAQTLADQAGYPFVVEQRNIDVGVGFWGLRFGNAILSRLPLKDCEMVPWPAYATWESVLAGQKRGVVCTVSDRVRLVAVHLEHRSEPVRRASARLLIELAERSALPVIAAGDFNSMLMTPDRPAESAATDLTAAFTSTAGSATFPSHEPKYRIDYVWANRGLQVRQLRTLQSDLSDHLPIVATIHDAAAGAPPSPR